MGLHKLRACRAINAKSSLIKIKEIMTVEVGSNFRNQNLFKNLCHRTSETNRPKSVD